MPRLLAAALFAAAALTTAFTTAAAIELPADFVAEDVAPGANFLVPTAIAFFPAADGRLLVAEKGGRVWVVKNGVKRSTPMWQRQSEVLDDGDRGLLGVAIDPDYPLNHYVYFLYTVDPDSNDVDTDEDGFGRLVRYRTSAADSNVVDPASRTVLMGTTWTNAPIIGSPSHTIGALRWGSDKSLLVTSGDGAQYSDTDAGGLDPAMFGPGRADPYLDIGAFRAQYLGSLNGKLLRIDRFTGHGYPSNPFWNGDPGAVRSRVWAYGLRNAFRFGVRPGTGSADSSAGNPGSLYIGDVGWANWEEINIARDAGRNYGWPCFEGPGEQISYQAASPAHGGCDSVGNHPWNPNPVSLATASWHHSTDDIGTPPGFHGNSAIAGAFYTATSYPGLYRNRFFFGDYASNWIKVLVTDANDQLVSVQPFAIDAEGPVDFAVDPASGDLHYVSINTFEVRRIRYTGVSGSNNAPVAVADGAPTLGSPPLEVAFSSAGSFDLDGDSLAYQWTFGDGDGSTAPHPTHTYTALGTYSAILTVTDGQGGVGRDTLAIQVAVTSGFPSTAVLDDFNRANGPLGGSWSGAPTGLEVDDSTLVHTGGYGSVVWNGGTFGPAQEAYFTVLAVTPTAPEHDVLLKVQGTSSSSAHIEVRWDAVEGAVRVATYTVGVGWQPRGGPYPVELRPGDRFGARAHPDGRVEIFVNGIVLGEADCSGWSFAASGGRIGMGFDNATSSRMEDFGGGTTVFASPPVAGIVAPADSVFYVAGQAIAFQGIGSDVNDPPDSLDGHWSLRLHHNNHVHIEREADGDTTSMLAVDHEDGTGVYYTGRFVVTDPGGLRDTAMVHLFPEVDLEPFGLATVPANPTTDTETLYEFSIANHGRLQSRRARWCLVSGATMLAQGDTAIGALDTVRISRVLPPALPVGTHELRVVVDTLRVVVETDETNNGINLVISVTGPPLSAGTDARHTALSAPYPNPTRGPASFALDLPAARTGEFDVLDLQGRQVWSWGRRNLGAGRTFLEWSGRTTSGRRAPPGLYLARVRLAGEPALVRRLVVLE